METKGTFQFPTKKNCSYYIIGFFFVLGIVIEFVKFPFRWIMSKVHHNPDELVKLKNYTTRLSKEDLDEFRMQNKS